MNHDSVSGGSGEMPPLPSLRPLWVEPGISAKHWESVLRPVVEARWRSLLGRPAFSASGFERSVEKVGEWQEPEFRVIRYRQATGPGHFQKVIVLHPAEAVDRPMPCAVVPFYQAETVAGVAPESEQEELRGGNNPLLQFGRHLARQGLVVACVEAYPYNTTLEAGAEAEKQSGPHARWPVAAREITRMHPEWTGLGKLVHDTSLALDLLLEEPGVDPARVLMMGHSLGGKMAFYTGALDPRVSCVIGSDFGLPWRSTNWDALWYLGSRVPKGDDGMAHHELLALLAPRPFFLIAGQTDTSEAWHYFEAARPVYRLYGAGERLNGLNHASGHRPTAASLDASYRWLGNLFRLSPRHWREPKGLQDEPAPADRG